VRVDHHLLIRQLNAAAENLLGISETRAFGKPFMPLVDDDPDMFATLQKALETGVCYAIELSLAPNDVSPEERIVDCRVSGDVQDGSSAIVELTDVTRRARINRENTLLVQHGAGRQMVRQLAHEIKNPLGGLRGAAQLLDRQLERADLHEYTRIIISEADRLAALVDTLLGPGGPPQKTPQNIHELIEYVVRIVQAETGDRLRIKRDYDPGLPEINLDRDQIVQALLNIVRNAVTALDGYGNLYLRTRAVMNFTIGNQRHRVVASIEIEDDGPGISPELQDSVFYPLVTSRADGTGLGLPVAQELAGRHGGLIEFESRPGRTVFYVRLPLDTDTHDD
jgi:two-component system nitrogen regulation sensor histidine kinase GlnL